MPSTSFFAPDELQGVLYGFNPWWTGRARQAPFAFTRIAFEACRAWLEHPGLRRAILLSGPRRVGKTTILLQLAEALAGKRYDVRQILYLSLDHPVLKLVPLRQLIDLYHQLMVPEGREVLLLLEKESAIRAVQAASAIRLHVTQGGSS
jgi:hypothetical protein